MRFRQINRPLEECINCGRQLFRSAYLVHKVCPTCKGPAWNFKRSMLYRVEKSGYPLSRMDRIKDRLFFIRRPIYNKLFRPFYDKFIKPYKRLIRDYDYANFLLEEANRQLQDLENRLKEKRQNDELNP